MRRTRQKDRDRPGPQSPWDEVVPGLWMGGHYWTDPAGELRPVVVGSEFDLVISLYARSGHGPDPHVEHLVAEIPDGPLTAAELQEVQGLARSGVAALDRGLTTLVRCHSGYNRSGLVVAQVLVERGLPVDEAVALVRRRRSPWALSNDAFTSYLSAGLDVAALLVGLDPLG
ncbi:protein phosphatase [Streptomyces sp. NBC_01443]|uniref:protein-tyrosine phosphatase family protein n=1 Tax=Streptomyces sp. NBC_01443 TaxID=2903868 RepID=UPI00225ADAFA|nr:protein phosphatase [Streptomyces sp. NBC_01443]MCX4626007.1 protein phosphatase [Streptomyces sp. NBC_01443]